MSYWNIEYDITLPVKVVSNLTAVFSALSIGEWRQELGKVEFPAR
jgi:hypothetical protein